MESLILGVYNSVVDGKISVLGISSTTLDGKVGTLIGTTITNYLTRNETILPSTFSTFNTTDNILINSSGANSYLQFKDTSGPNACINRYGRS